MSTLIKAIKTAFKTVQLLSFIFHIMAKPSKRHSFVHCHLFSFYIQLQSDLNSSMIQFFANYFCTFRLFPPLSHCTKQYQNFNVEQEVIEQEFHAAISAEKSTHAPMVGHGTAPHPSSQLSAMPTAPQPPPRSRHMAHHGISAADGGKHTDAELGELLPPKAVPADATEEVYTQKIRINDIEILETSFGVSVGCDVVCR